MILLFTDRDPDYSADYLAHGFCSLLGASHVVDFPRKSGLHWQGEPEFDCNVNLDTAVQSQDEIEQSLRDGRYDLVVIPSMRGVVPQRLYFWRELLRRNADRIVYIDGEDHAIDTRPLFVQTAGVAPAAYFKRELPIGESWAKPMAFGYPAERVAPIGSRRTPGIYSAFLWSWVAERGGLRIKLADALRGIPGFDVASTTDYTQRMPVTQEHVRSRQALIGVAPAGAGYHTNRHLSIAADGCCPLIERPYRTWIDAPTDGIECVYFKDEIDCVEQAEALIAEPQRAREIADAAQRWLLNWHTTLHRAKTAWDAIHGNG